MRPTLRTTLLAGVLAVGGLGAGTSSARAQDFGYGGYDRHDRDDGYDRGRGQGYGYGRGPVDTVYPGGGYDDRPGSGFGRGRYCTPPPPPPRCGFPPYAVRPLGSVSYYSSYSEVRSYRTAAPYQPW